MAIEISIELSDQDIEHFAAMARAVQQAFQGARIDEKSIMEPEISTYREFCQYRIAEQQRRKNLDMNREVKIEDWLADKRATLHNRMRKRRQQSVAAGRTRIYLW